MSEILWGFAGIAAGVPIAIAIGYFAGKAISK